jgi:hypothetical protein
MIAEWIVGSFNVANILSGVVCWIINFAFILVVAYLVSRQMRSGRLILDLTIYVFLWVFFVTLLLLIAGLAGFLAPLPLGLFSFIGLVVLFAIPSTRGTILLLKHDINQLCSAMRVWWEELPRWVKIVAIGFLVVTIIRMVFLIWALPPFVWDSLTYHLTRVAQWIQDQRIFIFDTPVDRIYTPANYEVFVAWFTLFIHHDVVVEAAGLPAYLLAGLSVYAIARSLEISGWASLLGAIAYLSTPALLLAVTGTKNDPMMAALYLMAAALIIDLSSRRVPLLGSGYAGRLLSLVLVLLLAVGTKPYIMHLSIGLLVIGGGILLQDKRSGHWYREKWKSIVNFFSSSINIRIMVVILLISGLFLGSYWYLRNWSLTGNPFYPYGITIGDTPLAPKEGVVPVDFENLWRNLKLFAEKFGDKQNRILPDLPNTTGWGWVIYGMGLPALAWGMVRNRRIRILAVGFTISFLAIMISNRASPWNMRYVVWFPALLCLALAAVFDWFPDELKVAKQGLSFLFVICLALNLVMTVTYNLIPIRTFEEMLSRSVWERDAALLDVYMPDEYFSALEIVGSEERLGYNVHANGFVYPLYRSDYSQDLVYVPFSPVDSCDNIANEMRVRGTRYLMVAPEHTEDEKILLLQRCALAGDVIRERGINLYVIKD